MENRKRAIVVHSGGMDSSICLALAIESHGRENVLSLSFSYGQRHSTELESSKKICEDWKVEHDVIDLSALLTVTNNALVDKNLEITHKNGTSTNTVVIGRNGLMARMGALYAHNRGAFEIYMGSVLEDVTNYPDCSRNYMDLMQQVLRIDLSSRTFAIHTPLTCMTKRETMHLAYRLGVLGYLLENTTTCYEGVPKAGCGKCPSCLLRNKGLKEFTEEVPDFKMPYELPSEVNAHA